MCKVRDKDNGGGNLRGKWQFRWRKDWQEGEGLELTGRDGSGERDGRRRN